MAPAHANRLPSGDSARSRAPDGTFSVWALVTSSFQNHTRPPPPEPAKPPRLASEPVRLMAILQRESRLLDFLLEDVAGASDQQLGAGVRDIHQKARKALQEHLTLEPILPGQEEAAVEVPRGFDPIDGQGEERQPLGRREDASTCHGELSREGLAGLRSADSVTG